MNDFKPEKDHQDQSSSRSNIFYRSILRSRKQRSKHHLAPCQRIMIGVAVLLLLLLIIAINSGLKAPINHKKEHATITTNESNIDISKSITLLDKSSVLQKQNQSQNVSIPSIKEAQIEERLPLGNQKQKDKPIEILGNPVDGLQQTKVLPTTKQQLVENSISTILPLTIPLKITEPVKTNPKIKTKPIVRIHTNNYTSNSLSTIVSNYTLQLSSATRSDTLKEFVKNNKLTNYKIYKTIRNDKPWYILIYGNYHSISEAKNAILTLPTSVQKKKPWVRKFQQVNQDQK